MAKVQFAHNRWANENLLEFLKSMPAEQYQNAPCSGNGSLAATVAHLILVQQSWIGWLDGSLSLPESFEVVKKVEELKDAEAADARWTEVDRQTSVFLDSLTDEAFVTERPFSVPGVTSALPVWEMLLQVSSHGVHTRGQIVSAIRATGAKPPEVSFLQFCLKTKQASLADDDELEN